MVLSRSNKLGGISSRGNKSRGNKLAGEDWYMPVESL